MQSYWAARTSLDDSRASRQVIIILQVEKNNKFMRTFDLNPKIPEPDFLDVHIGEVPLKNVLYVGLRSYRETMKMTNYLGFLFQKEGKAFQILANNSISPYFEIKINNITIYFGTMRWWNCIDSIDYQI